MLIRGFWKEPETLENTCTLELKLGNAETSIRLIQKSDVSYMEEVRLWRTWGTIGGRNTPTPDARICSLLGEMTVRFGYCQYFRFE